jgi:hypothetical protein
MTNFITIIISVLLERVNIMYKKLMMFVCIALLVLISIVGCRSYSTLDRIIFDKGSSTFLILPNNSYKSEEVVSITDVLNKATIVAPTLINLVNTEKDYVKFKTTYNRFNKMYTRLVKKAYDNLEQRDILFSFAVGYALADSVLTDDSCFELFPQETRKKLETYSGMSFAEYAFVHSFWTAFHYLVRTDSTERLNIPWTGVPLGSGFDASAGFIQITISSLLIPKIIVGELSLSPCDNIFYSDNDLFESLLLKSLLKNDLKSGLSKQDYTNKFLEIGFINHFTSFDIISRNIESVLLGDLFSAMINYCVIPASYGINMDLHKTYYPIIIQCWKEVIGGPTDIESHIDWDVKRSTQSNDLIQ